MTSPLQPVTLVDKVLAADGTKHKILLIHEPGSTRDALIASMQRRFDVRVAGDAMDGWQAVLIDQSIKAIVASVPVLEIDGYGLLQRIRRSKVSRVSGAPVVIVTSGSDHSIGQLATSFGASGFTRSSDLDGLRDQVQALIEPMPNARPTTPVKAVVGPAKHLAVVTTVTNVLPLDTQPTPSKEITMSRLESLNKVLKTLQASSPGVEASALISSDGLMIASALAKEMDETRVAAMTATLLNLGTRAATELRRGEVSEVIVRGDQGYAVMLSAGRGALLLVLATEATPLGLIFFDMREAVKGIKTVL